MKKIRNKFFILDRTKKLDLKQKVKLLLRKIAACFYKIVYVFCRVNPIDKKYKVSVCAIFKNEASYLNEWIEFNHIIGVEHFYLYNNNSEDDYLQILKPYIDSGLVTLMQWPKNQAQMECYCDCIQKYRQETAWMGFIDIDEFIVPIDKNCIYDILKPFENKRGAVKIYWKMFGTSGKMNRDLNGLVTEDFTVSWPQYYIVGKCFYNTNFEFDFHSRKNGVLHHTFWANYKGMDIPPVNVFDKICFGETDVVKSGVHPVQINHYFSKSYKEYAKKREKGDVYFSINPHDKEYFYIHENENTGVDYSAYKYLLKLKDSINCNNHS